MIYIALEMDYMQQQDSGSISTRGRSDSSELASRQEHEININHEAEWPMHQPEVVLFLVEPDSPLLGAQFYVPETQSQTHVQSELSQMDFEQFEVEEDRHEDFEIPPNGPQILEEAPDDMSEGDGRPVPTKKYIRFVVRITSQRFLTTTKDLPQLRALGISKRSIGRKLLQLKRRPPVSITQLFNRILDPRITDPFKNSFARCFKHYLENFQQFEASQPQLQNIPAFIKFHRQIAAHLLILETQTVANLNIKDASQT